MRNWGAIAYSTLPVLESAPKNRGNFSLRILSFTILQEDGRKSDRVEIRMASNPTLAYFLCVRTARMKLPYTEYKTVTFLT